MKAKLCVIAVINLLLLAFGARMLSTDLAQPSEQELNLVRDVVSLHDQSSPIWRELLVIADNGQPTNHTVAFRNGARLFERLEDGVVRESVELFPPDTGGGEKRVASFDGQGRLTEEMLFRQDGSLERRGQRRADGGWLEGEFDKDSKLVVARSFDSDGALESEEEHKSGQLAIMVRNNKGTLRIDRYSEGSELESTTWESANGYERFISYASGTSMAYEEKRIGHTTERIVYDLAGNVTATYEWSYSGTLRYREVHSDKPLFEQFWFFFANRWTLQRTVAFNEDGSVKATYQFDHSGKIPVAKSITFPADTASPARTEEFYATGFLMRVTIAHSDGQEEVQEFEEGKADRPLIPEQFIAQPENIKPIVQPLSPPPSNQYEHSAGTVYPHSPYYTRRGP